MRSTLKSGGLALVMGVVPLVVLLAPSPAGPSPAGPSPAGPTPALAVAPAATPPAGTQLAQLQEADVVPGDGFGSSVAISGATIVVGAPGRAGADGEAYIFAKQGARWHQADTLAPADSSSLDSFGLAVAISGTTIVVGAPGHGDYAGRAYVFTKTSAGWEEVELKNSDNAPGDNFGQSVAISGTTIAVGAPGAPAAQGQVGRAGRAYVFTEGRGGWSQSSELTGIDSAGPDEFGYSVGVSGATVVVGAPEHASYAGRAYVFTKTSAGWDEAELKGADTVAGDFFGDSVSISGSNIMVGAPGHASGGRAYVFNATSGHWRQAGELKGAGPGLKDNFGSQVAISGRSAVVGDDNADELDGAAYVFTARATGWGRAAEVQGSGATGLEGGLGRSVAVSGNTMVCGTANTSSAYVLEA